MFWLTRVTVNIQNVPLLLSVSVLPAHLSRATPGQASSPKGLLKKNLRELSEQNLYRPSQNTINYLSQSIIPLLFHIMYDVNNDSIICVDSLFVFSSYILTGLPSVLCLGIWLSSRMTDQD